MTFLPLLLAAALPFSGASFKKASDGHNTALVVVDCSTGKRKTFHPLRCAEPLPPCSTFKIYNTLIGLECGLIHQPNEIFWHWDGVTRWKSEWNRNLTLRQAFAASCVPAYQQLARKIGKQRMQTWLEKLQYGNRDILAGIDRFWLPAKNPSAIKISADEQARLLCNLVNHKLPISQHTFHVLKEIMLKKTTSRGALYGKTGSGTLNCPQKERSKACPEVTKAGCDAPPCNAASILNSCDLGWFVGYVESQGKTYAFACNIRGPHTNGLIAEQIVENFLVANGLL